MPNKHPRLSRVATTLGLAFALPQAGSAAISVYVSPPDIESAEDSGFSGVTILTENFNHLSPGAAGTFPGASPYVSAAIGATYTAGGGLTGGAGSRIIANDQYGGHEEGNYLGITAGSSLTISLGTTEYVNGAQYFGFYFTAGDARNQIDLYDGDTLLLSFSTASLIALLPKDTTVGTINGGSHNTNDYYGKPGTGQNSNEPYAYLHFVATGGSTFDKIVLQQNTGSTAIFENDNHSIMEVAPASIPPTFIGVVDPVPEPSVLLLSAGGFALFGFRRKRTA